MHHPLPWDKLARKRTSLIVNQAFFFVQKTDEMQNKSRKSDMKNPLFLL